MNFSGMVLANFRKLSIPASAAVSENKYFPVRPHTRHTKKKRIRKKYAKRILEWYRTEVAPC